MLDWIPWWVYGTGGALAVGALAFAFLNPLRALALAKDIGAFFLDKGRAAVAWARKPERNWWKIGCVSLASACAMLSWYADGQRREVVLVTRTLTAVAETEKARADGAADAATNNFAALLQCKAQLELVTGEDQKVDALNAEAVKAAQAAQAVAERRLQEWKARERSLDCKAALAALEDKCAAFSDY